MACFLNDCALVTVILILFPGEWRVYHHNDVVGEVLLERLMIWLAC